MQARCQGYHHRQFRRGSHRLRSGQTRLGDIPCRQATSRVLPAVPAAPSNKTFFILPSPYHVSENSTNSGVSVFPMSGSFLSSAESCAISASVNAVLFNSFVDVFFVAVGFFNHAVTALNRRRSGISAVLSAQHKRAETDKRHLNSIIQSQIFHIRPPNLYLHTRGRYAIMVVASSSNTKSSEN